MKQVLIKGRFFKEKCFPSLNDMLAQAACSPAHYNKMKSYYERIAINALRAQLSGWKAQGKVTLHFEFGEPQKGKIRDYDNIVAAGRKIINDAMTKCKKLEDDDPEHLGYGTNKFVYTSEEPYILITIEEVETPEPFS